MRIIVVSDTHGRASRFEEVVLLHSEADAYIHLGDGERDFDKVYEKFPEKKMYFVSGNCDSFSLVPSYKIEEICGKRIYFTHGASDGVKYDNSRLINKAMQANADILLYGHTHIPFTDYIDSRLFVMNPGSLGNPRETIYGTYGIIDIVNGAVSMNVARL